MIGLLMSESIPEGYTFKEADKGHAYDRVVNDKTGEWFFLTNRSFQEIDFHFSHLTSRLIKYLISNSRPEEKVQILDLGGGSNSQSSKDIKKKYGERVNCVSVNLTSSLSTQNKHQVMGNVTSLPIESGVIDFAYSRVTSELIAENSMSDFDKMLRETVRVLKSGSAAFLDGSQYAKSINNGKPDGHALELQEELQAEFFAKKEGLNLNIIEKLDDLIDHKFKNLVFLVIIKKPLKSELIRLLGLKNEKEIGYLQTKG